MARLKAEDYEYCPHCRQSFSFNKPHEKDGAAHCCWCKKILPHTQEQELSEEDKKRLEACLVKMRQASDQFYGAAVRAGNHAFIEFTGLMNEFIKVCEDNLKKGIDFTMANRHTSTRMKVAPYQFEYLKEKADCIFEGMEIDGGLSKVLDEAVKES